MTSRRCQRRKRRENRLKQSLAYELYGLIFIAICLLALTRFGWIGGAIYGVFRFFVGEWDFILPLTGIFVAFYLMMKRDWPDFLSWRWTGFVLLFFSLLIMSHLSFYQIVTADGRFADQSMLKVTWEAFFEERSQLAESGVSTTDIGGGMIGALGLTIFSYLFGQAGTKIVVFFMILIGLMLVFKFSYVSMIKAMNKVAGRVWNKGKARGKEALELLTERKGQAETVPVDPDQLAYASTEEIGSSHEPVPSEPEEILVIHDFADTVFREEESGLENKMKDGAMPKNPTLPTDKRKKAEMEEAANKEIVGGFQEEMDVDQRLSNYVLPSLSLLGKPKSHAQSNQTHKGMQQNARKLEKTLESFGVLAKVTQIHRGPAVTRYEVQPAVGVKVSRIVSLADDLALALAAKDIRIEAPIPGKPAIGIEVPNSEVAMVSLREVMETPVFQEANAKLSVALGRDISGEPIVANLAKMPHLLVAGATGSGKSVCINSIVTSLLFKAKPQEVKLMMIDPKMVELNIYNGIPHLLAPVVTDSRRAAVALKKVVAEMERRYELFSNNGTRDIDRYNQMMASRGKTEGKLPALPYIVVIVDELADLMMVAPADVEDAICRLAQMARAAGIHLIIATQRPSVDVITGVIKANIPSRIAFGVSSQVDSRTILDIGGAEKLLGRGDMLYLPVGMSKPIRVQGTFVSDEEVEAIVQYVKNQQEAKYQENMIPEEKEEESHDMEIEDELFDQAVQLVADVQSASVSMLQRRFRIGYTRAARLIDAMEARGIVGPYEGSKPREVLIPKGESHIS